MNLSENIISDFKLNSFRSALILFFYRVTNNVFLRNKSIFGRIIVKLLSVFWEFLKMLLNINCQISYKAKIGKNIRLLHIGEGVVISSKAIIGDNVTIFHQVTIGVKENLPQDQQTIYIGDNCYLSAGAKIISCYIEESVVVGPNAVVYKNVSKGKKVLANGVIK